MAKSYLRHPDNFFTGTRTLTLEQRGAYNDLLDLYISFDGCLHDNDQQIARQLAVDLRVWRRVKTQLIDAAKIEISGGFVVPTGAVTTLARCLATSVAGRKAADSRWHKLGLNPLIEHGTAYATAMPLIQDNKKEKELNKKVAPKMILNGVNFDPFWDVYPKRVGKKKAMEIYAKIIQQGLAAVEEVLAGAQRYAEETKGTAEKYIAHPATWLNGHRWKDDPAAGGHKEWRGPWDD
jgi:hypothetical protein